MAEKAGAGKTGSTARRAERDLQSAILETTLDLAERGNWPDLRLSQVAAALNISPAEILAHFRDKDAVADALFQRGWQAMLDTPPEGFAALPPKERLYLLLCRWFDALSPRHTVAVEMLKEKIYLSHPHHWVPLIFNLSRTIQWLRDAAYLDATGVRRQLEEVGLTGLFLATLRVWARDDSPGQERTKEFLQRRLSRADELVARIWGGRSENPSS